MYFLIYLSSSSFLYSDKELEDILTVSRRNNEKSEITGMLLYHEGSILQVLEGDELAVTSRYHRILDDDRHRGAIMIINGHNENRYFPEWQMGFRKLNNSQWDTVSGYLPAKAGSLEFDSAPGVKQEMVTFIQAFCKANFKF